MSKILPINTTSAVTPGKTFTVEVPVNVTHEQIKFTLTNLTKAQVTDIKVKIGTKTFQEFSDLVELDDFNDYYKRQYLTAESIFYFRRKELSNPAQRGITGLGLKNISSCTIECTIDAAAVSPDIAVESIAGIAQPLGLITKISRQTVPFVASGWNDIAKMPKIGKVIAYWLGKADVDEVILKRDSVEIINATKTSIESYAKAADQVRVPVSARFTTLDFILDGELGNGLEVLQYADGSPVGSIHARVKLGTAGDVTIITESLDSLTGA
jgi:hypothetical protein